MENSGRGDGVYLFYIGLSACRADVWRREAWEMIRLRRDLHFMFFTKRIDRLSECLPGDWGAGYEHVTIGCTVENQRMADYRCRFSRSCRFVTRLSFAPR